MRNFEKEHQDNQHRKYAYDFDGIIRLYMMRTFSAYFTKGKALELGCFEGDSTRLFAEQFDDLTVVEAAESLISVAKTKVPDRVRFVLGTLESVELEAVYDSIFLVHTLEHLDDPVAALARLKGWLSPKGRLFLVVPNADAPSRQIAVKMGLIETNNSITQGEREHGHHRTYSFDTLEHHARSAGQNVTARGGIFFKPFANYQFDMLLKTKIIDQAYLDGCYALGMQYPELTSSIYLICTR